MRKTFITNLILLVGVNLLVKPFYILGIEAEIQNRVGPETFGSYFALINFSFLLNILPDMGSTNWNTRHIAQNAHLLSKHFSRIFLLRLLLSLLYLVVVMVFGFCFDYSSHQLGMLSLLACSQVLAAMIMYLRSNLTGLHLFKQDSIVSILDRLLLVFMMSYLLWGGYVTDYYFNIKWLVWGQFAAYAFTFLVALLLVIRQSGKWQFSFDKAFNVTVLKQSMPYAALIFISMIAYRVDTVMIERIMGEHEAGLYAMSFRFFEAVNMIAYLFAVLLLPMFALMLKEKQHVGPLVRQSFQIIYVGVFSLVVLAGFWGNEILDVFYHNNDKQGSLIFFFLMCSSLCFSLQYVFGTLITASGHLKSIIIIAAIGVVLNVVLNFIFIPQQGAYAAAKSSMITQLAILIAQIVVVHLKYKIEKPVLLMGQTALFSTASIALVFYIQYHTINEGSLVYRIALAICTCLVVAMLTGMLNIKAAIRLLRQQKEAR
ncbi:MAG: oligosaccharide flippase family protein [Flavobacteriales bacterium]